MGAYREGFKVVNSDVVVKFPRSKTESDGRRHSSQEIARIRRLRESEVLRPFLPEVLYYDKAAGVVAMRYYEEFDDFEKQADAMGKMIQKLIHKVSGVRCDDIHTENVRQGRGRLDAILIDLGF